MLRFLGELPLRSLSITSKFPYDVGRYNVTRYIVARMDASRVTGQT